MILEHYSAVPLEWPPRDYPDQTGNGNMKPVGLWVSIRGEHDWPWWCRGEEFRLENLTCCTAIVLKPEANILLLATAHELDDFHRRYRGPPLCPGVSFRPIDWSRVAEEYDGIIIAPYRWDRRMHHEMMWYYGWDCASGCIWNGTNAISAFVEVEKEDA